MSGRKYRRLLLVLFVPLLAAGAIFCTVLVPAPSIALIMCSPGIGQADTCRTTQGEQSYQRHKKESPEWFDVYTREFEHNKFPTAYISASQRLIKNAQVIEISPYAGTDEGPGSPIAQLRSMKGQHISIVLGTGEGDRALNPLGCNQLDFAGSPHFYTAGLCGVPGGVAKVKFTVTEEGRAPIVALRAAVEAEIGNARRELLLHYALGLPLFLVLFLILSSLIWLIRKSIRYVAAG